ncbi:MAG: VOC family protein [Ignavibacteria bacterium]|nr:VOC family protein [Ignavibacteria bacterium]
MNPKICAVQINVSEMDKALDFYCNKIGFKVKTRELYPQFVSLENEGVSFILSKVEDPSKMVYPSESCTIINIQVENLVESMSHLKSKGVELMHDEPKDCPVGQFAAIRDPSGNILELLEFSENK